MSPEKDFLLKQELTRQLQAMGKAIRSLEHSYEKCQQISLEQEFNDDLYEPFDALTSRFARASDIFTKKLLGLIDVIELEEYGSLLDRLNRAEKKGIIASAEDMKRIRELRNEIAHEYAARDVVKVFRDVLLLTPSLLKSALTAINYCHRFLSPTT